MLIPEEFGAYYAVGTQKKSRGQAIFFEIDPKFRSDFFNVEEGIERCVPHEDGSPKAVHLYFCLPRAGECSHERDPEIVPDDPGRPHTGTGKEQITAR